MDAITTETVRLWAKELARLREEQQALQQRQTELAKKIEYAAYLGLKAEEPSVPAATRAVGDGDGPSIPELIVGVLRQAGTPLRGPELKKRLIDGGLAPERLGTNGAYLYSSLTRLSKRGVIKKARKKYGLADS